MKRKMIRKYIKGILREILEEKIDTKSLIKEILKAEIKDILQKHAYHGGRPRHRLIFVQEVVDAVLEENRERFRDVKQIIHERTTSIMEVKKQLRYEINQEVSSYIRQEEFIDSIVSKINNKQLGD